AGIFEEAGLPKGVFNLVNGFGEEGYAGDPLVKHPDVPLISFTGESRTGQIIFGNAAPYLRACRWNSAASRRRSSSTMPTWTQLSMPPSSVYSPLTASVAPLVPASWSSAASTTSSSSATQLRLSASRLAFLPIQPPKSVHWST